MHEPNPELEPNVPDWSNEPASDDLLTSQLEERGTNMGEVEERQVEEERRVEETVRQPSPDDPSVPDPVAPPYETPNIPGAPEESPADSPPVPAPDTSPPEEREGGGPEEEKDAS